MDVNVQQKIEILLVVLQERYNSLHIIRERVQSISLWILGILLSASGWLFQADIYITYEQKILYTTLLLGIWYILKKLYFSDLEKGFNNQRQILAKIEDSLGLYKKSYYNNSEDTLYHKEWRHSGEKGSEGRFFQNTYNLIAVSFGIFILSILIL